MGSDTAIVPYWLRRALPFLGVVVAAWVIGLGVVVHGTRFPLRIDQVVDGHLLTDSGWLHRGGQLLADLGDPIPFTVAIAILLVICAGLAGLRAALGAGLAVGTVTVLIEYVAKPLFDRHMFDGGYSYPSGHTGASFAAATVVVLFCARSAPLRSRFGLGARTAIALVAIAAALAISLAMVVIGAHYFTDTLGAAPLAVFVAVAIVVATDRWVPVSRRPLLRSAPPLPEALEKDAPEPMPEPSPASRATSTPGRRFP